MPVYMIPQVDRKFVIMECSGTLVALDQHAADERVRLEHLRGLLLTAAANAATGIVSSSAAASGELRGVYSRDKEVTAELQPVLSSVLVPAGAECLLATGEEHLYEAYKPQVERCAAQSI